MTLQQLNYVLRIAETGSFNRAAEQLFVAQPSLTSAVKELEKETGIVIFNRSGRGVTLTAEGAQFLPYARSVYDQYQVLLDAYGKNGARRQRFAVSMQHYSFAVKAFVEMTRAFDVAEYEFAIRETRTRDVIDDVAAARSEIGILYLDDFNRKALSKLLGDNGLQFTHLISCDAYVYLWKGHPLASQPSISLEDLTPYPCLSFEQGEGSSFYLAEEILSANEYPRIIKCCDRATVLNLMVGLNGYTLCSGIICEELNGGDYRAVPYRDEKEGPAERMELGLVTRKNHILSAAAQRYIEELKNYLGIREENHADQNQ
ncbi:MAG: LysR family transcriptional regulator [Lachnospiraceae bacterium]|nr:LysR family transcriptional regulator [Lachnospiraceae bacterium]